MPDVAPLFPETRAKYPWTPDMGEISGFGGGYEETCRNMLYGALAHLDEHCATPEEKTQAVTSFVEQIHSSFPTQEHPLENAIMDACKDDCTGAMHGAVVSHLLYIIKNGWDKWSSKMIEHNKE